MKESRGDGSRHPATGDPSTVDRPVTVDDTMEIPQFRFTAGAPRGVDTAGEAPTLADVVARRGALTGTALIRLAISTLTALTVLHRGDVMHGDVRPVRIRIEPDGLGVLDPPPTSGVCPIAAAAEAAAAAAKGADTGDSSSRVSVFLAPEQLQGREAGPWSDVFSWASVMVYAATGRHAFSASNAVAQRHLIVHWDPDLFAVPVPFPVVLTSCLRKDPARRPSSVEALTRLLAELRPGVDSDEALTDVVAQATATLEGLGAEPAASDGAAPRRIPPPSPAAEPPPAAPPPAAASSSSRGSSSAGSPSTSSPSVAASSPEAAAPKVSPPTSPTPTVPSPPTSSTSPTRPTRPTRPPSASPPPPPAPSPTPPIPPIPPAPPKPSSPTWPTPLRALPPALPPSWSASSSSGAPPSPPFRPPTPPSSANRAPGSPPPTSPPPATSPSSGPTPSPSSRASTPPPRNGVPQPRPLPPAAPASARVSASRTAPPAAPPRSLPASAPRTMPGGASSTPSTASTISSTPSASSAGSQPVGPGSADARQRRTRLAVLALVPVGLMLAAVATFGYEAADRFVAARNGPPVLTSPTPDVASAPTVEQDTAPGLALTDPTRLEQSSPDPTGSAAVGPTSASSSAGAQAPRTTPTASVKSSRPRTATSSGADRSAPTSAPGRVVPAAFGGTWKGTVSQPSVTPSGFPVVVTLVSGTSGGTMALPSLGCRASLTVSRPVTKARELVLAERVTSDPRQECADTARVALVLASGGTLRFTWQDADNPKNVATATLTRG